MKKVKKRDLLKQKSIELTIEQKQKVKGGASNPGITEELYGAYNFLLEVSGYAI